MAQEREAIGQSIRTLRRRLTLPKRFGLVGFGGLGGVVPGSEQFRFAHFLPGIGAGLRYELSTTSTFIST